MVAGHKICKMLPHSATGPKPLSGAVSVKSCYWERSWQSLTMSYLAFLCSLLFQRAAIIGNASCRMKSLCSDCVTNNNILYGFEDSFRSLQLLNHLPWPQQFTQNFNVIICIPHILVRESLRLSAMMRLLNCNNAQVLFLQSLPMVRVTSMHA